MMRTDGRDNKGALASESSLTSQNITKHKKEKAIQNNNYAGLDYEIRLFL